METGLQDECNLERSSLTTTKPVVNCEINQNYLKQCADNTAERNCEKEHIDKYVKDRDAESSKILSVEEKTKTDSRIVLKVKKRPSFMVSAILENDESENDNQPDIFVDKRRQLSDMLNTNEHDERDEKNNNEKHINAALETQETVKHDNAKTLNSIVAKHVSDQNVVAEQPGFLTTVELSSHKQFIENAHDAVSHSYTQIIDKTNKDVESSDTNGVEVVFPTIFGSLSKPKDNANDSQLSYFESKINEIKRRKMKEINQISEVIEEKRIRKRKQERPQPISYKQRNVEVDHSKENAEQSGRKSKRKQIVTKRHFQYDTDLESEDSNEIKQTPLCSKLCKPDSRKSAVFQKRNVERIPDFEETSQSLSEDSNMPCTTNRYRRHFLKQLRIAEAAKSKSSNIGATNTEHDTNIGPRQAEHNTSIDNEDSDSEDDYFFDGKRIKVSELEDNLDSNKCKVCSKEFSDIGMLMAHYICHSSIEKERVNFRQTQQTNNAASIVNNAASTVESTENSDNSFKIAESSNTYFCRLCNQTCTNIATLQEHVLEHSANFTSKQQGHFECNFCHKSFATQGSLYLHKKIHTGDNPYTCVECHKHFRDKTRLTTHMRVHTGEKPYTCDYCSKDFSQKGNLKLHQQKIHFGLKRGKYRCKQCGVYFSEKKNMTEHLKIAHAGNDSKNGIFSRKEEQTEDSVNIYPDNDNDLEKTKAGISSVDKAKTFAINETIGKNSENLESSGKNAELPGTFDTKEKEMRVSATTVTVPVRTKMGENSNSSVSETSLVLDEDSVKSGVNDFKGVFGSGLSGKPEASLLSDTSKASKFTCPICSLPYQTATSFNRHFLTHGASTSSYRPAVLGGLGFSMIAQSGSEFPSGVKKVYRCEECSLDFVSFPEFQCHLKSHKDSSSKVMCNICQKQMSSSNLLDHMRIHTGEKPYACIHCGKLFRRSHHLQTHLRTHTGDRPYVCVDCGKTFARGDHLQNHKRTHTGEKPYKCEICEKSYSQSHHLLRHKRTHTGEKPYNCELCDKRFSRDHHLKKHMETHRVVIFTQDKEGSSQKHPSRQVNLPNNVKTELPTMPMATRGSDRIAQLLSSTWYTNIASGLMADIVQQHLSTEKEPLATGKEAGGIVADIVDKHLLARREPNSTGGVAVTTNNITPASDTLASKEAFEYSDADLRKSFEEDKETYSKMDKVNDRSLTIGDVMFNFKGTAGKMGDISDGHMVGKDQDQYVKKDSDRINVPSDISSQFSDGNDNMDDGDTKLFCDDKGVKSKPVKDTNGTGTTQLMPKIIEKGEQNPLELNKRDITDLIAKGDREISFMNQLRAISVTSTLEEIVKNRLNEDFALSENVDNE